MTLCTYVLIKLSRVIVPWLSMKLSTSRLWGPARDFSLRKTREGGIIFMSPWATGVVPCRKILTIERVTNVARCELPADTTC